MSSSGSHGTKRIATDSTATETNSESSRSVFSDTVSHSTNQTDIESDSELSTSSEEPTSSSEDDEDSDDESDTTNRASTRNDSDITNVRLGTKPEMKLNQPGGGLLQRLKTFLPALEAANEELEQEKKDGTIERRNIERVEEGEGSYIELDLGLGVLEEKNDDITTGKQDSDSESDGLDEDCGAGKKDLDVISKLMGHKKDEQKSAQIEEVGEA